MERNRWEGVLLDFDGTVSKNSLTAVLGFTTAFIRKEVPVPPAFLRSFFRVATTLPLREAVELLFKSFGLERLLEAFFASIAGLEEWEGEAIRPEPGFFEFADLCKKGGVPLRIFSSAGSAQGRFKPVIERLGASAFLSSPGYPKSDPRSFKALVEKGGWNADNWLYVDDSPLALWGAKEASFRTALMRNSLFGEEECRDYREYCDFRFETFAEIAVLIGEGRPYD